MAACQNQNSKLNQNRSHPTPLVTSLVAVQSFLAHLCPDFKACTKEKDLDVCNAAKKKGKTCTCPRQVTQGQPFCLKCGGIVSEMRRQNKRLGEIMPWGKKKTPPPGILTRNRNQCILYYTYVL